MTDIDSAMLTIALKRFKSYAENVPVHHLRKQMAAWSKHRDQDSLQRVLCCPLGDVNQVWTELKDIV